jgi:hypothetical protein
MRIQRVYVKFPGMNCDIAKKSIPIRTLDSSRKTLRSTTYPFSESYFSRLEFHTNPGLQPSIDISSLSGAKFPKGASFRVATRQISFFAGSYHARHTLAALAQVALST